MWPEWAHFQLVAYKMIVVDFNKVTTDLWFQYLFLQDVWESIRGVSNEKTVFIFTAQLQYDTYDTTKA